MEWDLRAQQRVFERYQREFNEERRNEALGMRTPAERYRPSAKRYDGQNPEFGYAEGFHTRRVYGQGTILWAAERIPVSPVLAGQNVGLREQQEDLFAVYSGRIFLSGRENRTNAFVREARAERWANKKTAAMDLALWQTTVQDQEPKLRAISCLQAVVRIRKVLAILPV